MNKINRNFLIGLGVLAFVLLLAYVGDKPSDGLSDDQVQLRLIAVAEEASKRCPFMIDSNTRADNIGALSNKKIRYSYTLINANKEDFTDSTYFVEYRQDLLNRIKTTPEMKFFKENDVTFQYIYFDRNGQFVIEYIITPKEYKSE